VARFVVAEDRVDDKAADKAAGSTEERAAAPCTAAATAVRPIPVVAATVRPAP